MVHHCEICWNYDISIIYSIWRWIDSRKNTYAVGEGFAEVDFGLPLPVRCAAIVTLGVADVEGILCAGGEFEGFEGAISTYDDLSWGTGEGAIAIAVLIVIEVCKLYDWRGGKKEGSMWEMVKLADVWKWGSFLASLSPINPRVSKSLEWLCTLRNVQSKDSRISAHCTCLSDVCGAVVVKGFSFPFPFSLPILVLSLFPYLFKIRIRASVGRRISTNAA